VGEDRLIHAHGLRLFERSKFIGSLSGFKRIRVPATLVRSTRRQANVDYTAAEAEFKERFSTLLYTMSDEARSANRMDRSQFVGANELVFRDILDSTYAKAFRAGALYVGNSEFSTDDFSYATSKVVSQIVNAETAYFRNLAKKFWDAGQEGRQPPIEGSVEAYARSLEAQFYNGLIVGATEEMRFDWLLGNNEDTHCVDCLSLAANGPYTKYNVPTTPRAGDTRCLYRCRCELKILEE